MSSHRVSSLPTFTDRVDQNFFIQPYGGSRHPTSYLDRFPEELYSQSPDSHFVRFLYSLLGPAGVGWLKKNYLDARLALTESGFETFDIEKYYANPFRFARILAERYAEDPLGLLPRESWEKIKAQDERYRTRAVQFFNAARLGTTPDGMKLAAQSGLNHPVEIIENYKYLFDFNSDEPKGFEYNGNTRSTNEFIIVPRREFSTSEQQQIEVTGFPTGGNFVLVFDGRSTAAIDYDAPAAPTATSTFTVQEALEDLPNIGEGNVKVTGGPGDSGGVVFIPYLVTFTGELAGQDVPPLEVISALTGGVSPNVVISPVTGGVAATDEAVVIDPELRHNLQTAIDYLRPVNALPTIASGKGTRTHQVYKAVQSTSQYTEVVRYVTGSRGVPWPAPSRVNWIEAGKEKQAPRIHDDLQHHYTGFHGVEVVKAYTDEALDSPNYLSDIDTTDAYRSVHVGRFDPQDTAATPFLAGWTDSSYVYTPDRILADYAEPLTVTTQEEGGEALINGIYPASYTRLPGVAQIKYADDQFWSSKERKSGAEYVELDLGVAQAVNYIAFESTRKPIDIEISFDTLDLSPRRRFVPVTPVDRLSFPSRVIYAADAENPWASLEFHFTDRKGQIPFTRHIRIRFSRRIEDAIATEFENPFSINIRNLRVGRNAVL